MKNARISETMGDLDDLLDLERVALLQGKLDDVSRLHARKEGLMDALNRFDFDEPQVLRDLHGKLVRNQKLLDSALDGVRAVTKRLATIQRVRQSLDTYDCFGQKKTVDLNTGSSVEKRA